MRWTAVAGPNAALPKLMVRWYGGLMFVKLRADSCPPLKLFLEDDAGHTPHNWNEREKAVRKQGYYIEVRKKGRSADSERIVVVELDALMWLLKERNREKGSCYIPKQKCDKQSLWRWQQWAALARAYYSAPALGYECTGESVDMDEAIKPVKKEQLLLMVREYREQHDPENAAGRPNLSDMLVGHEKHGRELSLRCELWDWYEQHGLLADDLLQTIFDEDLLGDFTWVSVDASQPNGAAAARPQPTARGWDAVWSAAWGWVFSNGAGAVQLVDPGAALTGEERAEGLGGAARTPSNPEQREAFRQPAAGHAAMEEDDAPESQAGEL